MGIISWFKRAFLSKEPLNEAPSPSTHTEPLPVSSGFPSPADWQRKIVILSVAPNSYKEWVTIEDLYQAFKERMEAGG
jgi:hypothetical protein